MTLQWPNQDGGDPAVEASPRDIMYTLDAANAAAEPKKLAETDLRYLQWPLSHEVWSLDA